MPRPTRPSADETRQKILIAAKAVFLEKGFDAAFIKDIAQRAKVNTNLIFHHFTNKETLWHKVKASILEQDVGEPNYDCSSARAFFKSLLDYRFTLYGKHPDLVKLIQWQQLTENESALIGADSSSPNHWLAIIRDFQKRGKIKKDIKAEQMMLFIIFSTHAPFLQKVIPFNTVQTTQYKEMIFTMCCKQFINQGDQ